MGMSDEALLKRLNGHPVLRGRVESVLLIVDDEMGNLQEADAAEMQIIEDDEANGARVVASMGDRTSRQDLSKSCARLSTCWPCP